MICHAAAAVAAVQRLNSRIEFIDGHWEETIDWPGWAVT